MKCFVQLVSQCLGDIVAGQVARNISQCNIPGNGQNRCETSCKNRSTFRATCLATILAVAGYVTLWNVAKTLRDKLHETFHSVTATLVTSSLQAGARPVQWRLSLFLSNGLSKICSFRKGLKTFWTRKGYVYTNVGRVALIFKQN